MKKAIVAVDSGYEARTFGALFIESSYMRVVKDSKNLVYFNLGSVYLFVKVM